MDIQEITPNVYVSTVYPGINVGFVLTDGGPVAVDAPLLPADAQVWRERVREIAGRPIRYTILTDHRPERVLGAGLLGAPVIAGRGTFDYFRTVGEEYGQAAIEEWSGQHPDAASGLEKLKPPVPEITLSGRLTLHSSPHIIVDVIAGAGPGSLWVRLPQARVLFAGDTVVVGTHPFLGDAPDTRAWLSTLVDLRRSYFPINVIVPGRGPVSAKAETRPLSEYMQLVRRRIRSFHVSGRARSDLDSLVPEFLPLFPVGDEEEERVQRRIGDGLERVYEELWPEAAVL